MTITLLKQKYGILINNEEIGFSLSAIEEVIECYKNENIPIMGGDVYIKNKGTYVPTYDNWYFNKSNIKQDYLNESIECAKQYIKNYKTKEEVVIVLVPN